MTWILNCSAKVALGWRTIETKHLVLAKWWGTSVAPSATETYNWAFNASPAWGFTCLSLIQVWSKQWAEGWDDSYCVTLSGLVCASKAMQWMRKCYSTSCYVLSQSMSSYHDLGVQNPRVIHEAPLVPTTSNFTPRCWCWLWVEVEE